MVSTERLAELFVEVADTLVDEFDLVDFLHDLTDHATDITGATAVGLMLADHGGHLHYMASSSESARQLELMQLQYDEGPCLDCYTSRMPVVIDDLSHEVDRWPTFTPIALDVGIGSVHAFPMRLRRRALGALNVFGDAASPLDPDDAKIVQAMADIATIAILQERAVSSAELQTEQLQSALNTRIVIEQAKGMVARQHGCGVDEAFKLIRSQARRNQLRLADLAQSIVNDGVQIDPR
jgi:GAF domain-containing protein